MYEAVRKGTFLFCSLVYCLHVVCLQSARNMDIRSFFGNKKATTSSNQSEKKPTASSDSKEETKPEKQTSKVDTPKRVKK